MEILEILGIPYFKNGSGIHIKKKNRGKFTEYCNGKVTQECIDKAKKSNNPTLRKRATFAENSRGWAKKHYTGGWLKTLAAKINEHGKQHRPLTFNETAASYAASRDFRYNPKARLSNSEQEHVEKYVAQKRKEFESSSNQSPVTRAQAASAASVIGSPLSFFGPVGMVGSAILSAPDLIYDWAASIAEPNIKNHISTASNHLEDIARIIPGKWDDLAAKGAKVISNGVDTFSVFE